ncbi:L-ribulose-5-phosphate 4-epimerase [Selenomonas sputigena]|uniref:L-ribulose-5-phosphate 4-epimerase n=1 Tax=Selenomonas sputigena TaxID=69823 RepID=A0ABV3X7Z4_9FIRM
MLEELKQEIYEANMLLPKLGIVIFTWGNVSGIDREKELFVIKPSGVPYEKLRPEDMVVVDMEGNVIEGELNPSSDTPTHRILYREFPDIGAVVHTHSFWAVSFAQAGIGVEAMGTTHADTFYGRVPVTEALTKEEIENDYEENTGKAIVCTFRKQKIDPLAVPAVLVRQHGPFAWGKTASQAVETAKILDVVAEMNYHTLQLAHDSRPVPQYLLNKHYSRKHGANAYYGQNNRKSLQ